MSSDSEKATDESGGVSFLDEILDDLRSQGVARPAFDESEITELLDGDVAGVAWNRFPAARLAEGVTLRKYIERVEQDKDETLKWQVRRLIWMAMDGYPSRDG